MLLRVTSTVLPCHGNVRRQSRIVSFMVAHKVKKFSTDTSSELNNARWAAMWDAGIAPGQLFDAQTASPLLSKFIKENRIPAGRALVPGCGRGYDVTALATPGRYVLGLDIAEKAVVAARERRDALPADQCASKENADFQTTSFFEIDVSDPYKKFDFIYDYTFMCALDPSVRTHWAEQMARLTKPNGELLTLIFPIRPPDEKGPPFQVSLEMYKELLLPVGFECLELDLLPPELCHEGRDGSEVESGKGLRRFSGSSGIGLWRKL